MKLIRKYLIICFLFGLMACNNSSESTTIRFDSLGKRFDSAAQKLIDSTKMKARALKNEIKDKLDSNSKIK